MFRYLSIPSYCYGIYTQSSFTSSVQLKYSGFLLESTSHVLHRMNQTHRFDATENINQSPSGIVVSKKRKSRVDQFNKEIWFIQFRYYHLKKWPSLVLTNTNWIIPLSFLHVACHGYVLHKFPPSWQLSLTDKKKNIMHCCLQITRTGFKPKQFILFLLAYMISSFIHTRILQRPHLFCNTFIPRYFLIGYKLQLCELFTRNRCNAIYLQEQFWEKISELILPWALHSIVLIYSSQ